MFPFPESAIQHSRSRRPGLIDPMAFIGMPLFNGLTHYWNLEEASGSRADAAPDGGAALNATASPGNAAGLIGNALSLVSASGQYLSHATFFTSTVDRSVSVWIKPTSAGLSGQKGVMSVGFNPTEGNPFMLMVLNQVTAKLSQYENGSGSYHNGSTTLVAGNWYHIVFTTAANTRTIYLNNSVELTYTQTDSGNNTNFYLGSGFSAQFDGLMDEAAIWSRALTSSEVAILYNGGAGLTFPFA